MSNHMKPKHSLTITTTTIMILTATIVMLTSVTVARAGTPPVKLILASHFGREVNLTEVEKHGGSELEDICTVSSGNTCKPGKESSIPGGFTYPEGVAVNQDPTQTNPHYNHVYIADTVNNRVQELTATGAFLSMFGGEVNETKTVEFKEPGNPHGITETEENTCTQEEIKTINVKCKTGTPGGHTGHMTADYSIAVDPTSGNIYVQDHLNWRVDAYTADGHFVWMAGKEVNETKDKTTGATEAQKNLCTAASGDTCKTGVESATGPSAFKFEQGVGDLLAVGGPEDLLYVGDEHRVQELKSDGTWVGEILLTQISEEPENRVLALAVDNSCSLHKPVLTENTTPTCKEFDPSNTHVFLVYRVNSTADTVREFVADGKQVHEFKTAQVGGIALDSSGRLAVTETEAGVYSGSLYQASTGHLITKFPLPDYSNGIAFSGSGGLYAAVPVRHEVLAYTSVPVAELVAGTMGCSPGSDHETDATFDCDLKGMVDPWGISETEVGFQWGSTPTLGEITPFQPIKNAKEPPIPGEEEPFLPVKALVKNLRPNETIYYRVAGYDHNVKALELLTSETTALLTPLAPPRIVTEPSVLFVTSSSAVIHGELNPENAMTEYWIEYTPSKTLAECPNGVRKENCPGIVTTTTLESPCQTLAGINHCVYRKLATTLEATGLQPNTEYHYRVVAENENITKSEKRASRESPSPGPEGSFTTLPGPMPQALTGASSALGATSATVSGTVNPDGLSATYAFELGVYNGAATQYGIVFSGPAGAGTVPVEETLTLTGLQPATTYAYRIKISNGYGTTTSTTTTFTTTGLPSVLPEPPVLAQLPVPNIHFPKTNITKTTPKCKHDTHNKCIKQPKHKKTKKAHKTVRYGKPAPRRTNKKK
jgi:hypothetical protein